MAEPFQYKMHNDIYRFKLFKQPKTKMAQKKLSARNLVL